MTRAQVERLPKALRDQIDSLNLRDKMRCEENLLYEAEWVLECIYLHDENDWPDVFGYTRRDVRNLERYVSRLRDKGIEPVAWDE